MMVWIPRSPELAVVPPRPTVASQSQATASHCWQADTTAALNDQLEPASSDDNTVPRFTWWDRRGSQEWIQYDFARPATVSRVAVYWYDDTGRGGCRVPRSWTLLYREEGLWKPVSAKGQMGTAADGYNEVAFAPVTTDGLRIEVQLQPQFSGGILEWQVGAEEDK